VDSYSALFVVRRSCTDYTVLPAITPIPAFTY